MLRRPGRQRTQSKPTYSTGPAVGDTSKIEWTDATWNPVTGCTKVSPGCDHCYAEGIANRFRGSAFPNGFDVTAAGEASRPSR
jgi:DNA repair photolyase